MKTLRKQGPLNQRCGCTHELTETACIGPAWVCTRWHSRLERSGHMPQVLTQKFSPVENHWQMKMFSPWSLTWPRSQWPRENVLYSVFGGPGYLLLFNSTFILFICLIVYICFYPTGPSHIYIMSSNLVFV